MAITPTEYPKNIPQCIHCCSWNRFLFKERKSFSFLYFFLLKKQRNLMTLFPFKHPLYYRIDLCCCCCYSLFFVSHHWWFHSKKKKRKISFNLQLCFWDENFPFFPIPSDSRRERERECYCYFFFLLSMFHDFHVRVVIDFSCLFLDFINLFFFLSFIRLFLLFVFSLLVDAELVLEKEYYCQDGNKRPSNGTDRSTDWLKMTMKTKNKAESQKESQWI